ncbi:hypothetical protein OH77DRAFT_1061482 [Trametes cingulata]|nr:hypothetical protein OH77DRAFT_1061482 [Trametes cingulata]
MHSNAMHCSNPMTLWSRADSSKDCTGPGVPRSCRHGPVRLGNVLRLARALPHPLTTVFVLLRKRPPPTATPLCPPSLSWQRTALIDFLIMCSLPRLPLRRYAMNAPRSTGLVVVLRSDIDTRERNSPLAGHQSALRLMARLSSITDRVSTCTYVNLVLYLHCFPWTTSPPEFPRSSRRAFQEAV